MAGQLDSLFKNVAKQIVSDLGASLDTTISYIRKGVSEYDIDRGEQFTVDTTFSNLKVPFLTSIPKSRIEILLKEFLTRSENLLYGIIRGDLILL